MSKRLQDKVAIVTGGGRGIGQAIALAFAREGAHIAIAEYDPQTGQATVQEIEQLGQRALFIHTDMRKKSDIDAMVAQVITVFDHIDILVNNAGIHIAQPFLEVTEELFDRTIETNLKSQFFCSQAVARHMATRSCGKIINISSISAEVADPGASHYCVGKGGVQMLTRAAALELAEHHIHVNAIMPGTIKTKLTPWYDTDDAEEYRKKFVPWPRMGRPEDIAGAAVFLACDESDYVTGASIVIDGGLLAQ
jgi:glucose 1-dehydrogenase